MVIEHHSITFFSEMNLPFFNCNYLRFYTQSEIYRPGNVENDWNSSVVPRSPSKAIIGSKTAFQSFPIISNARSAAFSMSMLALVAKRPGILCFKIVGIPINPSYLWVGYITPTKHLTPNFTSLVSLTPVSV